MPMVLLVVIGAAAGYVASRLMRMNLDLPSAMVVGVIGALLGGVAMRLIAATVPLAGAFLAAVLGSVAVLWVWKRVMER